MFRRVTGTLITLVLLLLCIPSPLASREEPVVDRSLWVWDIKTPQVEGAAKRLLSFCKRHQIKTVFISCYTLPPRLEKAYQRFNRLAHKEGISVHALSGDPRWAKERYHHFQLDWLKTILDFNKRSYPTDRFDAIHSDIEPYGLSGWQTDPKPLLRDYLGLVQKSAELVKNNSAEEILCFDIPFWWDDDPDMVIDFEGERLTVVEHMLKRVSHIAVMDYRNFTQGANGSIELVKNEIDLADAHNAYVYVGQETQRDISPDYITFGGKGPIYTKREMEKLERHYKGRPSFLGLAIHHYVSFRELMEEGS